MRQEFKKMYEDLLKEKRKAFIKSIIYLVIELILWLLAITFILKFFDYRLLIVFFIWTWANNFSQNRLKK